MGTKLKPTITIVDGKIAKFHCSYRLCPMKQQWIEPLESKTLQWSEKQTANVITDI